MEPHRWKRVQELFEAALARQGAERLSFLASACGDDVGLLKEVGSLIEADEKAQSFLETPPLTPLGSNEPLFSTGQQIDHYRIIDRLGAGGMGVVYKAVDTRLDRPVALKLLSGRLLADQNARNRFILEAKVASKLDHHNICTIYEIDTTEGDLLYISMAFCEGRTLQAHIDEGPMPPEKALDIAAQVACGLQKAHAHGIIHRDIKPANIIVTPEYEAKIVDFGIAKLLGTSLTETNAKIGTVAYMSPEHLKGEAVDHRSDLWSLGVILHEMLTGQNPFDGDSPAAILHAVLYSELTAVSQIVPGLSPALDRILDQALARPVRDRYQAAEDLLSDLDAQGDRLATECAVDGEAETAFSPGVAGDEARARPSTGPRHLSAEADLSSSEGELRQVTVMFVDLCDFAKLSGQLEPEAIRHLLGRFFDTVDGIVERYRGMIDKHIGDTVMAVFGAPTAHDNDCERALRAAADIHECMKRLGSETELPLQAHIGIACGQELAGALGHGRHHAYTITGNSVTLAKRLDEMAGPGETLISDPVYRTAPGLLEVEARDCLTVTETEDPAPTWRVVGLRQEPSTKTTAFVGRRTELHQFTGVIEDCRESRRGQVVFVRGQAGIGKTRLVQEFQSIAADHGFDCHSGLVLDFGTLEGQDAIGALVRSLLSVSPDDTAQARLAAAQGAVAEELVYSEQLVFLNDLLNIPQPVEFRSIYDAMKNATRNRGKQLTVAALLKGVAKRGPLLVTVEDIHWAGALTLTHLATMALAVAECPALLVMTSRVEGDPLGPEWYGAIHDTPLITFNLAPLRTDEAARLATEFMDTTNALAQSCIERAAGNPFFLEQLLRSAQETQDQKIPATIQSLVLSRLDRLAPIDKAALRAASVIGQRFSLDTLRQLLEQPAYDGSGLLQHYLVRPEGEDYLFAHALIQEGVYGSLLKSQRRGQHLRAAEWFAERDAVLRAEHLDRAEDRTAPQAYLEAAQMQMSLYRYDQALHLVERGLAIAREEPDSFRLICLQGELLRELGSVDDSLGAYEAALEVAGDDPSRCRAWIGLAQGMRLSDDYDKAFEALDRAEAVAAHHGLTLELAQLHYLRGSLYFPLGRIKECREQHQLALDNARHAGSPEREALALSGLGDAAYAQGRMFTAHEYFQNCLKLCRIHGFGRTEAANRFMIATVRIYLNELDGALEDSLASAELAARVGHKRAEIVSRLTAGWVHLDHGELERAQEQAELGLAVTHDLGAKRFQPFLNESLARVRLAGDDRAGALELLESALADAREGGAMSFIGPWLLGTLARTTDDPKRRRAALAEGEELLTGGCVGHNYYRFYQAAMEAALGAHDWEEAGRYADALEAYTRPEPGPWADFYIAWGRTLAAFGRGRRDRDTMAGIAGLKDDAGRIGLRAALPLLAQALSAASTGAKSN